MSPIEIRASFCRVLVSMYCSEIYDGGGGGATKNDAPGMSTLTAEQPFTAAGLRPGLYKPTFNTNHISV